MTTLLFALLDTSRQHLVHKLVSDHHQVMAEAKYIQDYVVSLPLVAESGMNVNARNTKASSL